MWAIVSVKHGHERPHDTHLLTIRVLMLLRTLNCAWLSSISLGRSMSCTLYVGQKPVVSTCSHQRQSALNQSFIHA